jgi:hypothetical protein
MHRHRFGGQANPGSRVEEPTPTVEGFVLCPLALQGWQGPVCPWQDVYQRAYAQARAVVRPSLLERCQRTCAN